MSRKKWTRIPASFGAENDRRDLCALLASAGLEVRVVRVRPSPRAAYLRFVEYREQPEVQCETQQTAK